MLECISYDIFRRIIKKYNSPPDGIGKLCDLGPGKLRDLLWAACMCRGCYRIFKEEFVS